MGLLAELRGRKTFRTWLKFERLYCGGGGGGVDIAQLQMLAMFPTVKGVGLAYL